MNSTRIRRLAALAVSAAAFAAPSAAMAGVNAVPIVNNVGIATQNTHLTGVFDVAGGSAAAGAKVIQNSITGSGSQRWNFVSDGAGNAQIVNVKSGLCLTTNGVYGAQLYVTYCNPSNPRQSWNGGIKELRDFDTLNNYGNLYNPYTGVVVDVQGSSSLAGTPIVGWYKNAGNNQRLVWFRWN